jgi:hypothetical protein
MATYRLSVSVSKRSDGRSATAMAAYRSGQLIEDYRTGRRHDYTRKSGVLHAEIIAPDNAPEWATNRAELWNRSEAAEKTSNAVIAREIQLSLPHEMNDRQRRELAARFTRHIAESYGIAIDLCIHAPGQSGDQRNHHAHLMLCQRTFDAAQPTGLSKNKIREFDAIASQHKRQNNPVEQWRSLWQQMVNDALKSAQIKTENGTAAKVSHLSYERQHEETRKAFTNQPDGATLRS